MLNEEDFIKFHSGVKRGDIVGITGCPGVGFLFPVSLVTVVICGSVGLGGVQISSIRREMLLLVSLHHVLEHH